MMKRKRLSIFLFIGCLASIFLINRDIRVFTYIFPYGRSFSSKSDPKGFYPIGDSVTLKRGEYEVRFIGKNNGPNNAYRVIDEKDSIICENVFPEGEFETVENISISANALRVIPGIYYESDASSLTVSKIVIYCPNVLYRETLVSHVMTSLCVLTVFSLLILRFCFPEKWKCLMPAFIQEENERIFLFFVFLTTAASFPTWINHSYIVGDDLLFHLARIQGIADSLKAGYFPARIHLFTLSNYGHGSGFFYPQLWIYIPAVLRICGYSIITSYYTFVTLCTFLAICSIYYCTYRLSGNKNSGIIAAILYAFASYRLINIYYRAALGEIRAFVFAPLIICSAYDITHGHKEKWPVLALGFFGLLGAHLITLGIFGIVFLVLLGYNGKRLIRDKQVFLVILKAGVCVIALYAYFILPLIEQWQNTELVINSYLSSQATIDPHPPYIWTDLFTIFNTWDFYNERRHPFPGIHLLLSALLPFFTIKDKRENICYVRFLGSLSIFTLWMSTNLFPWSAFQWLLSRLQFSWRLEIIPAVLLPVCAGILLVEITPGSGRKVVTGSVLALCTAVTVPFMLHVLDARIRYYENYILEDDRLGTGEYLPVGISKSAFRILTSTNKNTVNYESQPIKADNPKRSGLSFSFDFDLSDQESRGEFEILLTYYYGYKGIYQDEGDSQILNVYQSKRGLTAVNGIESSKGNIRIWYEKTPVQKTGEVISLISLAVIIAAATIGRRKAKKNSYV